ncbi:hypothetical protein CCYN49044_60024 [Capnocytophaga cynodegmi]|uniref:Uncharacterized protein n=1 Tax=Capnocytophaga cynodegmi TaxID=28189 RepID=A0A0B7H6A5_9FLAO|nr:hypothetical protein CCYN74_10016 [Capnocytophaga cynodegmi]CEN41843.1 hypothetical protein CCYN49044_60024 [Capnocytophaga cynodegmi]
MFYFFMYQYQCIIKSSKNVYSTNLYICTLKILKRNDFSEIRLLAHLENMVLRIGNNHYTTIDPNFVRFYVTRKMVSTILLGSTKPLGKTNSLRNGLLSRNI